jgi:hypothetical protein
LHESVIIELPTEDGGALRVRDAVDARWLAYYRDLRDGKSDVDVLYSPEWPKRAILLKKLALPTECPYPPEGFVGGRPTE